MTQLSEHRVPTEYGALTIQIYHNRAVVHTPHTRELHTTTFKDVDDVVGQAIDELASHFDRVLDALPTFTLIIHRSDMDNSIAPEDISEPPEEDVAFTRAWVEVTYETSFTIKYLPERRITDTYTASVPHLVAFNKVTGEVYPYTARDDRSTAPHFGDVPEWVLTTVLHALDQSNPNTWTTVIY